MECLHRFCRACIDKSMRLGNNECPACRAHCASRRSLRDDPNFDNLVAALYPNLDQYEEEEMADFGDQIHVNRQIQENIAGTFKRQSAAIARRRTTAAEILRKAHGNFQIVHSRQRRGRARGRGRGGGRGFR
jgi:E3 ubiquitin-protein ligase RNF1/2